MKKLLFVLPIVALLAAGCSSSQQASSPAPVQTSVAQNSHQPPAPESPVPFSDISYIVNKGFLVPTQSASSSYENLAFLNGTNTSLYYPNKDVATFGYTSTYMGNAFVANIEESSNSPQSVSEMETYIRGSCLQNENIGDSIVISQCPKYSTHYAHFIKNGHRIIVSAHGVPDEVLQDLAQSFK